MANRSLLVFPTSKFLDDGGNISPEWILWLQNLQFATTQSREVVEYNAPVDGFNYTIANDTNVLILRPAAPLAIGAVTMPKTPSDGQPVCVTSSQIVTVFTAIPNLNQSIISPTTAISLGFVSWVYQASDATWYRTG